MKLQWKVAPKPSGRYRSFEKRGWPTAYYIEGGRPAAFIDCEDGYRPSEVALGEHRELTVRICNHQHPNAVNSWVVVKLKKKFETLGAAKGAIVDFLEAHPEYWPVQKPSEVPLEVELSTALLELLEALAYRKAGGDAFVMNVNEPQIVDRVSKVLVRAGYSEEEVLSLVRGAEYRAKHP